ncbi:hypothetical protein V1J52_02895 [Streptomyces sp. TRM 70351]|uniref:hypothetical protein n=1 Tax=Streptomyces sp. TRM 70351 TaxID=3116552 RepID=UPI002E7BA6B9|nr:hypothetical protein [Streptomyces sp. TRM 70351]MEE1927137.1 hypothetical protein [Streptomyces sp. TRM 70351]
MRGSRWTDAALRPVLAAVYFLVLTPAGVCLRLVRDPLRRAWDRSADSYWSR